MGDPNKVIREPIFASKNYRDLDAEQGWVAGEPMDPFTAVLDVAGAVRVAVEEFRALDANFGLGRPLVNGDFQVWELRGRKARVGTLPRMSFGRQAGRHSLGRMVSKDLRPLFRPSEDPEGSHSGGRRGPSL